MTSSPAPTPEVAAPARRSQRQMLRQLSPVVTMTATWLVRRSMIAAYERRTGKPAPLIYSRGPSPLTKVLWTASVAAAVALIEIVVLEMIGDDD